MAVMPKLVSLVFCNRIETDRASAEYSLMGIFHHRRFAHFPTPRQAFGIYAALHGGSGEGRITTVIARAEDEAWVYSHQKWTAFADPDLITTYEVTVTKCVFPSPGRYIVTPRFKEEILTQRILDIFQE